MAALESTDHGARILWLGRVADRDAALASAGVPLLTLTFAGPEGEAHGGLTRASCSRVKTLYARGTPIRNTRQLTLVSREEMALVAARMDLERIDPAWLGATVLVEGLADLSHLPPSSRLQGPDGVTLVVDMENRSCQLPARVIEAAAPGHGARFRSAAAGLRGITAWVEREGTLRPGDRLRLFVPDQPRWRGEA